MSMVLDGKLERQLALHVEQVMEVGKLNKIR